MLNETVQPSTEVLPDEGIFGPTLRLLTIGLVLVVAGGAFETLAVATTLPATVADLGGLELYGWAFSAFMLANVVGLTLAGQLADQRGTVLPFAGGVVLFAVGLLAAGLAASMPVLVASRVVQGLGGGALASVAYVAIGRGYPAAAKARMLAVLSSAWVVPGMIGPALAGLIADVAGWRWVFLGLVPLPMVAAVLSLPALRKLDAARHVFVDTEPMPQQAHKGIVNKLRVLRAAVVEQDRRTGTDTGSLLNALRLAAGAGLLLAGLSVGTLWLAVMMIGLGLVLGAPALLRVLPADLRVAAPGLAAAVVCNGLLNLGFFGIDSFVPLTLTSLLGQSATMAGLALTAATITWTIGAWVQATLAPNGARRGLALAGLLLAALGIAGVALMVLVPLPIWFAAFTWAVAGLGMGFGYSTNSLVVLEHAPAGREGVASAALQLATQLGTALGAGVGGALIAAWGDQEGGLTQAIVLQCGLMVAVLVLGALAALRLPESTMKDQ